jgi:hypothetical protein
MEIIKDARVINAILRKMSKENNFEFENVYVNQDYKYIQTIDHDKKDADFCRTEYKGSVYKVRYFDGCFSPFMVKLQ